MSFYFWLTASSILLSLIFILLDKKVFKIGDTNLKARQASHSKPTSRLGGAAILISCALFSFILTGFSEWQLFITVVPLFFMGLLEDLGFNNSAKVRLLIAALSSAIGIFLFEAWLSNIDTIGLDWLLSFPIIGILFTIFAIVGLVNAINLIDGVNGLASGQVIISSFAISIVAMKVGESNIANLALIIGFSTLGLFLINYPFGYLFLGDAGAYTLGFLLAWMLVLLSHRHPELSDWALLSIVIWPVADTLLAAFRRKFNSVSPGQPDRLHFHQLTMRAWRILSKRKISQKVANPLSAATILPLAALPASGGALFCFNATISALIAVTSLLFFFIAYFFIIYLVLSARRKTFFKINWLS